jgi:hypothetical protein
MVLAVALLLSLVEEHVLLADGADFEWRIDELGHFSVSHGFDIALPQVHMDGGVSAQQ